MSTIAQLVAEILDAPAPVLFLDTCAIMDVVRAPRDEKLDRSMIAAETLVALTRRVPRGIHLAVSDIVLQEWNANVASARADANAAVNAYGRVANVAAAMAAKFGADSLTFPPLAQLPDELQQISKALLDGCVIVDREPTLLNPAMDRVLGDRPAKKKTDIKDWYLLEVYLAVARDLKAKAYTHRVVFVSSNTADFAGAGGKPHPDLADDFSDAGLRYAVSLDSAVAQLRGNHQFP